MKKIALLFACAAVCTFISCGPSQEELDKQKKLDDSLFEKDRNTALDNANKMLDTSMTADTMAKKEEKKSK